MNCAKCGAGPLLPDSRRTRDFVPPRWRTCHRGRGLCVPCYDREWEAGTLLDWPRATWPAAELVEEAEFVRATRRPHVQGRELLTWREVAAVSGVSFAALDRARCRVKARAKSAA